MTRPLDLIQGVPVSYFSLSDVVPGEILTTTPTAGPCPWCGTLLFPAHSLTSYRFCSVHSPRTLIIFTTWRVCIIQLPVLAQAIMVPYC